MHCNGTDIERACTRDDTRQSAVLVVWTGQVLVYMQAITTLLSMQQHAPPGCPPLQLATLGNQILTISQTVSIGLSYLEADDADAVMVCADELACVCICMLSSFI